MLKAIIAILTLMSITLCSATHSINAKQHTDTGDNNKSLTYMDHYPFFYSCAITAPTFFVGSLIMLPIIKTLWRVSYRDCLSNNKLFSVYYAAALVMLINCLVEHQKHNAMKTRIYGGAAVGMTIGTFCAGVVIHKIFET